MIVAIHYNSKSGYSWKKQSISREFRNYSSILPKSSFCKMFSLLWSITCLVIGQSIALSPLCDKFVTIDSTLVIEDENLFLHRLDSDFGWYDERKNHFSRQYQSSLRFSNIFTRIPTPYWSLTYSLTSIIASGRDQTFVDLQLKSLQLSRNFFQSIIILFKILVTFSCQSSSDVFYFIKTYLINQNMIKFNFNLTLPYYIFKLSAIPTLIQKKIKTICN